MTGLPFLYVISQDSRSFSSFQTWKRETPLLYLQRQNFRIGAPLAMTVFALTRADAVTFLAAMHMAMGALGFSVYLLFVVVRMDK
jgi:hypothetical protein